MNSSGISPGMKGGRDDYKWSGAVRALVNHQIQGSSADILKFSMVKVSKELAKRNLDEASDFLVINSILGKKWKNSKYYTRICTFVVVSSLFTVENVG